MHAQLHPSHLDIVDLSRSSFLRPESVASRLTMGKVRTVLLQIFSISSVDLRSLDRATAWRDSCAMVSDTALFAITTGVANASAARPAKPSMQTTHL
jgi:hypothetical protein